MRERFSNANGYGMPLDDSCLLRYLRAEKRNLGKAVAKLESTLRCVSFCHARKHCVYGMNARSWRQEFGVEAMDTWADVIAVENSTGKTYVRG
jgi:hypothetical protein